MEIDIHKVLVEVRSGTTEGPEVRALVDLVSAKVLAQLRNELRHAERDYEDEPPRTRVSEDRRIRR